MTYATLVAKDNLEQNYLTIFRVKRLLSSWTNVSGNIYYASWTYGDIDEFYSTGVKFSLGSSTSPSVNQYYFDSTTNRIYANKLNLNGAINFATEKIYISTKDQDWYQTPTNSSSGYAFYRGVMTETPIVRSGLSDSLFGFFPRQTVSIGLFNDNQFFNSYLHDTSFFNSKVEVYHVLGSSWSTSNIQKIFTGFISGHSNTNTKISFEVTEPSLGLEGTFLPKPDSGNNFYETITYSNVDMLPTGSSSQLRIRDNALNKPIREIFGRCQGVRLYRDYGFISSQGTTDVTDNAYICHATIGYTMHDYNESGWYYHRATVSGTGSTTTTTVTDASGICVRDLLSFTPDASSTTMEHVEVLTVNYSTNAITHTAASAAISTGQYLYRSIAGRVTAIRNQLTEIDIPFSIIGLPIRSGGFNCSVAYGHLIWVISAAKDSDQEYLCGIGIYPNGAVIKPGVTEFDIDGTTDLGDCEVYADVYGIQDDSGENENGEKTNCLANAAPLMHKILVDRMGIDSSIIDKNSFFSVASLDSGVELGFSVPKSMSETDFPSFEDIVGTVIKSDLLKIYYSSEGEWTCSRVAPIGTTDSTLTEEDVLLGSKNSNYRYEDVYKMVYLNYAYDEQSSNFTIANFSCAIGRYFHQSLKTLMFETYLQFSVDVALLGDQLIAIFTDRKHLLEISTKNSQITSSLDSTFTYTDTKLDGNLYDGSTEYSRDFSLENIEKNTSFTVLTLNDQKGIEDNSGDF